MKTRKTNGPIRHLAVLFLFLFIVPMAQAAVLNVPAGYTTVQSAIDAAEPGDTVQVSAGVYYENIVLKNGVTILGSGAENCVLIGDGTTSVVFANGITIPAAVYGFTITGGAGSVIPWSENRIMGGGIFADQSVLTIVNNRIFDNEAQIGGGMALMNCKFHIAGNSIVSNKANSGSATASNMGGGIFLYDSTGKIEQNTISNNLADSGPLNPALVDPNGHMSPGGGICMIFFTHVGQVDVAGNLINNNTTSGSQHYGGGLYCYQFSNKLDNNINIKGNTITGNQGLDGGGIAVIQCSPTISHNNISENSAHWGGGLYGYSGNGTIQNNIFYANNSISIRTGVNTGGGGILCDEDYSPTIQGNTFASNTANNYGGGLEVYDAAAVVRENAFVGNVAQFGGAITVQSGVATIERNYITGNQASAGSGGGLFFTATGSFSLRNNLIVGNFAADYGGGISVFKNSEPKCINNTITGNTAGIWGGGVHSFSNTFKLMNNVIADNLHFGLFAEESTLRESYNNVYNNGQGDYYGTTAGKGSISFLPEFSSTNTFGFESSSPCINAGNPGVSYNDPDGTRNDMGAYGGPAAGYIPVSGNPLSAPDLDLTVKGKDLTVSWTPISMAKGYTLYYSADPDMKRTGRMDMGTTTDLSVSLESGTCFYVAIKAYGDMESDYSNIEHFCIP